MQRTPAIIAACLLLASLSLAGEATTNSTSLGSTTNTNAPLSTDQALYWKNMGAHLAGQKPFIAAYVPDDKYKLRIGDRVSFQVSEDRDSPKSLVVADSGELDVPYLGRMAAVDRTCKQLAADIKTQLEKEYYYRASVVLALDSANHALDRVVQQGQV